MSFIGNSTFSFYCTFTFSSSSPFPLTVFFISSLNFCIPCILLLYHINYLNIVQNTHTHKFLQSIQQKIGCVAYHEKNKRESRLKNTLFKNYEIVFLKRKLTDVVS